jgi:transcriptional regulator with XRE-family HTH domain
LKNRIKEFREMRGLSQSDLGKLMDTTGASVSRYEKEDQRVNMPLLAKLAKALRCSPLDLISDDAPKSSSLVAIPLRCRPGVMHMDAREVDGIGETSALQATMATDNSMAPMLSRGDVCILDTSVNEPQEGVMAFDAAGQTKLRRVIFDMEDQQWCLHADNPAYPAQPLGDARPVGKVVMMIRKLG